MPTSFTRSAAGRSRPGAQAHTAFPAGGAKNLYRNLSAGMVPGTLIFAAPGSGRRVRLRSSETPEVPPSAPAATPCYRLLPVRHSPTSGSPCADHGDCRPFIPPRVAKRKPELDKKCASMPVSRSRAAGAGEPALLNPEKPTNATEMASARASPFKPPSTLLMEPLQTPNALFIQFGASLIYRPALCATSSYGPRIRAHPRSLPNENLL